jgi:hypothetical protein
MAWALGALLEGPVGFGYPWAVVAPSLIGPGVAEIDAIRVAAMGSAGLLRRPDHRAGRRHQRAAAQPVRLRVPFAARK